MASHVQLFNECPVCGGQMVGREDGDTWSCDTCDYIVGEGADNQLKNDDKPK